MRYLITGGCGFLGTSLAISAMNRGHKLCIYDNLSRVGSQSNLAALRKLGDFHFVEDDIQSAESVAKTLADFTPDAVFHLAGQVAMTTSISNPRLDFETNALGSFNILEAVRVHAPAATVIYSSTNKVYGDLEWARYHETDTRYVMPDYPGGIDETAPLEFHSPYGCSKGSADQYMLDYARIFGLKTFVFRHSSMYGSHQHATLDQGWIGWFCMKALESRMGKLERPFTVSGNGKQVRDLLHANDLTALYFKAVEKAVLGVGVGRAYNIGGGMENSLSLLELLSLLEAETGARLSYERLPARQSDQKVFVADYTLARETFGWSPRVDFRQGIKDMLQWTSTLISKTSA